MPCYKPLVGYRSPAGGWQKRACNGPQGFPEYLTVPCGQCIGCRLERSRQWAIRCVHENKMHADSCFITLTYDDDNLPPGGTLVKSDFQKFMKRLRKAEGKLRFFHCGEYGETTFRPHYHALLFGWRPRDPELFANDGEVRTYTSKKLRELWPAGHSTFGEVTFESAAYVARYCTKKITGDAALDHYRVIDADTGEVFDRLPEYSTQSRRPGIGRTWLERYGRDSMAKDEVIARGFAMRPPRYYDNWFEHADPQTFATNQAIRIEQRIKKHGDPLQFSWSHDPKLFRDHHLDDERLRAGLVISKARLQNRGKIQ